MDKDTTKSTFNEVLNQFPYPNFRFKTLKGLPHLDSSFLFGHYNLDPAKRACTTHI